MRFEETLSHRGESIRGVVASAANGLPRGITDRVYDNLKQSRENASENESEEPNEPVVLFFSMICLVYRIDDTRTWQGLWPRAGLDCK